MSQFYPSYLPIGYISVVLVSINSLSAIPVQLSPLLRTGSTSSFLILFKYAYHSVVPLPASSGLSLANLNSTHHSSKVPTQCDIFSSSYLVIPYRPYLKFLVSHVSVALNLCTILDDAYALRCS